MNAVPNERSSREIVGLRSEMRLAMILRIMKLPLLWNWLLVFVLAGTLFLYDLGENSIRYSDEATHVRVEQEMIKSGNYFSPTLDGQTYLNKPPLKMWLSIAAVKLLGQSNFSFRLIDGLSAAAIVAFTFLFGYRILGSPVAGFIAAIVLCGSQGFLYGGRFNTATQDAFVVFTNCVALWCFLCALQKLDADSGVSVRGHLVGAAFAMALGVLTKSVVGLVPLIILVPVVLWKPKFLQRAFVQHRTAIIQAVAVFLLPVGLYFGQVLVRFPDAWARVFGYDIKQRLLTEGFHNPEKWWFYLDRLFVKQEFAPNWLLAAALTYSVYCAARRASLERILISSWALVPLLLFSSLQSRAFHYLGPAFPGFALAIAALVIDSWRHLISQSVPRLRKVVAAVVCIATIFTLSVSLVKAIHRASNDKRKLPIELAINDLKSLPWVPKVVIHDFQSFLEGDPYQRWRQSFYLDSVSASEAAEIPQPGSDTAVLTSWQTALELLRDPESSRRPCAYAPLWKPEKKRQSVRGNPDKPDAVALLFSECEKLRFPLAFRRVDRKLFWDDPDLEILYGIGRRDRVAGVDFQALGATSLAFTLRRDDILSNLGASLSVLAAVENGSQSQRPQELMVLLNDTELGSLQISGGKFRDYLLEIKPGALKRGANLFVIHDRSALAEGRQESRVLLAGLRIQVP